MLKIVRDLNEVKDLQRIPYVKFREEYGKTMTMFGGDILYINKYESYEKLCYLKEVIIDYEFRMFIPPQSVIDKFKSYNLFVVGESDVLCDKCEESIPIYYTHNDYEKGYDYLCRKCMEEERREEKKNYLLSPLSSIIRPYINPSLIGSQSGYLPNGELCMSLVGEGLQPRYEVYYVYNGKLIEMYKGQFENINKGE